MIMAEKIFVAKEATLAAVKSAIEDGTNGLSAIKDAVAGVANSVDFTGTNGKIDTAQSSIETKVTGVDTKVGAIKTAVTSGALATNAQNAADKAAAAFSDTTALKTSVAGVKGVVDNILTLVSDRPKRYGFRVSRSEADPYARVTYLFDAENIAPAVHDASTGRLNLNGWADKWFITKNHACMLDANGQEVVTFDPNDYSKSLKGTALTGDLSYKAAPADTPYNAMAAIPLVWVKRYNEGNDYIVIFCEEQYDETYTAAAFTDSKGFIQPYAYMAMYEGYKDADNKLRSLAGNVPTTNTTAAQEYAAAAAVGTDFTVTPWSLYTILSDLLILITHSTNCQDVIGEGYSTGGSGVANLRKSGDEYTDDEKSATNHSDASIPMYNTGAFWGKLPGESKYNFVKVFHIENLWAHIWKRAAGLYNNKGAIYAQMNQAEGPYATLVADSKAEFVDYVSGGTNGYSAGYKTGKYGTLSTGEGGGAENRYECDSSYYNNSQENLAILGGSCHSGSLAGCRCVFLHHTAANPLWNFGAALAKV